MTLFLIILFLVAFSFIANCFPKYSKIFITISILLVLSCYFVLTFNSSEGNLLNKKTEKYNLLVDSLKNSKLYLYDLSDFNNSEIKILNKKDIYKNYTQYFYSNENIRKTLDLSYYNNKFYLYFGITPVLLFYLPLNLMFKLYVSNAFVAFILSSLIFILSLLILKNFNKNFLKYNTKIYFKILNIFLIGFCNYVVILAIKPNIYEVTTMCAATLLLGAIYLFMIYLTTNKNSKRNTIVCFITLLLSLSVGCRPQYVLLIPIFFIFIIYFEYKNKRFSSIYKTIICFLLPCIIYGSIIATYNYLRFDSIFEFGWKYQLNPHNQIEFVPELNDFITGLKYNLLKTPIITKYNYTIFSFNLSKGHRIASELGVGILYNFPIVILLFLFPIFFRKIKYDNTKYLFILFLVISVINFNIACIFGVMRRYAFEYLYIVSILSLMMFYVIDQYLSVLKEQKLLLVFFIMIFIYTTYVNISLLFCLHNSFMFIDSYNNCFYTRLINFLFNTNIPNDYFLDKTGILDFISSISK